MNDRGDTMPVIERKVWVCDGCSSWTDRAVTREELLSRSGPNAWGWVEVESDDPTDPTPLIYCPECE